MTANTLQIRVTLLVGSFLHWFLGHSVNYLFSIQYKVSKPFFTECPCMHSYSLVYCNLKRACSDDVSSFALAAEFCASVFVYAYRDYQQNGIFVVRLFNRLSTRYAYHSPASILLNSKLKNKSELRRQSQSNSLRT